MFPFTGVHDGACMVVFVARAVIRSLLNNEFPVGVGVAEDAVVVSAGTAVLPCVHWNP